MLIYGAKRCLGTFVSRKRVVGKPAADAGKRRLGSLLKDRTKISPTVRYARDFDTAIVHAIKNHIRMSKNGTQPRRNFVACPPHQGSIGQTLTRFRSHAPFDQRSREKLRAHSGAIRPAD